MKYMLNMTFWLFSLSFLHSKLQSFEVSALTEVMNLQKVTKVL